jgi:chromosome segregation ATPase
MSPPVKRPTTRASKDQILAAFDQLNSEYKKLASSAAPAASSKELPMASASDSKNASRDSDTRPHEGSIEGTIGALLALRSGFGSAVSGLSAKLTAEASRLTELRKEVDTQAKQLAELHEIKVSDDTLATVVRDYQIKSDAFKLELSDKQQTFEADLEARTRAWSSEKEERGRTVAERDEIQKKSQKRGVEEYGYELSQKREAEADSHEQQRKAKERALDELVEGKNKGWAEREKQIADLETQHADLAAKFEELPQRLDAALKRAKGEGAGIAGAQSRVKADLLAKEIDGDRRVFELRIKSLEATIKERTNQIETLTTQLTASLKQGQDLAVKAIEGASNSTSFMAVKEIALEQAKNTPKNK